MKKISLITIAAVFFACPLAYAAHPQSSTCVELAKSVDFSAKEMSAQQVDGFDDNSAIRESNRQLKINNELLLAQMNLNLMQQYHCPLPRRPIGTNDYMLNAMECKTEKIGGNYKSPKCDQATWIRDIDHKGK